MHERVPRLQSGPIPGLEFQKIMKRSSVSETAGVVDTSSAGGATDSLASGAAATLSYGTKLSWR